MRDCVRGRCLVRLVVGAGVRILSFFPWREGRHVVVLISGRPVVVVLGHVDGPEFAKNMEPWSAGGAGSAGELAVDSADLLPGVPVCGIGYALRVCLDMFPVLQTLGSFLPDFLVGGRPHPLCQCRF